MKTIKVSEATGVELDWLVAKCEGYKVAYLPETADVVINDRGVTMYFDPCSEWSWGGPIIEREKISTEHSDKYGWITSKKGPCSIGPTPLIAAMRCYVASKLGETAEVPEELV